MTICVDRITRRKAVDVPHKNLLPISRDLRNKNNAEISRNTMSRFLSDVVNFGKIGIKKSFIRKKIN